MTSNGLGILLILLKKIEERYPKLGEFLKAPPERLVDPLHTTIMVKGKVVASGIVTIARHVRG